MSEQTILIIDDDHALVSGLKEGLEGQGFKVSIAYDGLQGVLQAHQSRPAAIILDFNMPAGGGASVYERLRGSTDTAAIPIIFMTGATVDEVKVKIRSTPKTYFLKKPASLTQLSSVLDKILGGAGAPAEAAPPEPKPAAANGSAAPAPAERPAPQPAQARAAPGQGQRHEFETRVAYADTDALGIVYYGSYLRYFELGRTELLRSFGVRYRDFEKERKLHLPVVEARCQYLSPARYDDRLLVRTWLAWLGPASVCFQNEIVQAETGTVVARGFSRHAVLDLRWRPVRLPEDLRALLAPRVVG